MNCWILLLVLQSHMPWLLTRTALVTFEDGWMAHDICLFGAQSFGGETVGYVWVGWEAEKWWGRGANGGMVKLRNGVGREGGGATEIGSLFTSEPKVQRSCWNRKIEIFYQSSWYEGGLNDLICGIFAFLLVNICFDPSSGPPHRDGSNGRSQHMSVCSWNIFP